MTRRKREYADKDHEVMDDYYGLCERYTGRNAKTIKRKLGRLIERDPNFLDSYLLLHEILQDEGDFQEAEKILGQAYDRALNLITNKKGDWPDILRWGWLKNRHIIRTIANKAISLWSKNESQAALDLLRKLLLTNPNDNVGARFCILGIRMNMGFEEFENRFNKDGLYDSEIIEWFGENYSKFPDEFDGWEKAVEEHE